MTFESNSFCSLRQTIIFTILIELFFYFCLMCIVIAKLISTTMFGLSLVITLSCITWRFLNRCLNCKGTEPINTRDVTIDVEQHNHYNAAPIVNDGNAITDSTILVERSTNRNINSGSHHKPKSFTPKRDKTPEHKPLIQKGMSMDSPEEKPNIGLITCNDLPKSGAYFIPNEVPRHHNHPMQMMRRTNTDAEPTPNIEYPYMAPERSNTAPSLIKPAHTLVTPATSLTSGESSLPRPFYKQRMPTPPDAKKEVSYDSNNPTFIMNVDKSIVIDKNCSIEEMRTNWSNLNVVSSLNSNASEQSSLKRHSQSEPVHSSVSSNEQSSFDSKRPHLDESIPPNQSLKDILDSVNEENKLIAVEGDVNASQPIPRPLTPESSQVSMPSQGAAQMPGSESDGCKKLDDLQFGQEKNFHKTRNNPIQTENSECSEPVTPVCDEVKERYLTEEFPHENELENISESPEPVEESVQTLGLISPKGETPPMFYPDVVVVQKPDVIPPNPKPMLDGPDTPETNNITHNPDITSLLSMEAPQKDYLVNSITGTITSYYPDNPNFSYQKPGYNTASINDPSMVSGNDPSMISGNDPSMVSTQSDSSIRNVQTPPTKLSTEYAPNTSYTENDPSMLPAQNVSSIIPSGNSANNPSLGNTDQGPSMLAPNEDFTSSCEQGSPSLPHLHGIDPTQGLGLNVIQHWPTSQSDSFSSHLSGNPEFKSCDSHTEYKSMNPKDLPITLESDVSGQNSDPTFSNISPNSGFMSIVDNQSDVSMNHPLSLLGQDCEYQNFDITPRTSLTPPSQEKKIGPIDGSVEVISADYMCMGKTLCLQTVEQQLNSNHDSIVLGLTVEEPRQSPVQLSRQSPTQLSRQSPVQFTRVGGVYDPPSLQLGYTDAVPLNEGTSIPDYVHIAKQNMPYHPNQFPQNQADYTNLVSSIVPENVLTSPTNVKFPNDPIPAYEQFVNIEVPVEPVEPVEPVAPKKVPRSVDTPITFKEYCENEWHGYTNRAKTVREGYSHLSNMGYSHLLSIRGDNYCAVRSTLFQAFCIENISQCALLAGMGDPISAQQIVPPMFEKYPFLKKWSFANKKEFHDLGDTLDTLKLCIGNLAFEVSQVRSMSQIDRMIYIYMKLNTEKEIFDFSLMEALKFYMFIQAAEFWELSSNGRPVPDLMDILFLRDTCMNLEQFLDNHMNNVGDGGGLEMIEMFLLGYTLQLQIRVTRISSFGKEDFLSFYPQGDYPREKVITISAEDDRHYNAVASLDPSVLREFYIPSDAQRFQSPQPH